MSGLVHRRFFLAGAGALVLAPHVLAQPAELAFPVKVAIGGELRAQKDEVYDPAYVTLAYPGGDVADDRGVCTDTVIRAFRHAGVDLQEPDLSGGGTGVEQFGCLAADPQGDGQLRLWQR